MTVRYSLKTQEHMEFGGIGVIVDTGRSYFEPALSGVQVAHDLLEHPTKPHQNGIIDELMALGGIIAGRIESGYSDNPYRSLSLEDFTADIRSLALGCLNEGTTFCSQSCTARIQDPALMGGIRHHILEGLIEALEEWDPGLDDKEISSLLKEKYNLDSIVGWVCKGHQQFRKRFSRLDLYTVSTRLFSEISRECDRWLKEVEFEGERADLYVDFKRYRAWLEQDYGQWGW